MLQLILNKVAYLAEQLDTKVFLVGGAVRDLLLNRPCGDLDFVVAGGAVDFAKKAAGLLGGSFILLDEKNAVARIAVKKAGTVFTADFTGTPPGSIGQNLLKRDFTINAMALPLQNLPDTLGPNVGDYILDTCGGLQDLRAKTIKMVYPEAFKDDPLRLLRAMRLAARLEMAIDENARAQIKKDARLLSLVSAERIRDEFFKLLEVEQSHHTILEMDELGLTAEVIPFRDSLAATEQNGYHSVDVWRHCLASLGELEKTDLPSVAESFAEEMVAFLQGELTTGRTRWQLLKFCSLIHDCGKAATKGVNKAGRITFLGHEQAGARLAVGLAGQLQLSNREINFVNTIVFNHMRPLQLFKLTGDRAAAIRRYFRKTDGEGATILLHALADHNSDWGPLKKEEDCQRFGRMASSLVQQYWKDRSLREYTPLLTGQDLLSELGLTPGPKIGKLLARLEKEHLARGEMTRTEALTYCRQLENKTPLPD